MGSCLLGLLLLIVSCSSVREEGGERSYVYDELISYELRDLRSLAPAIIETSSRDPQFGKLSELFRPELGGIRRIGVLVFESIIQPTPGGLSGSDQIYLSSQGKQLLTEKLLSVWEESLPILAPELDLVPSETLKSARAIAVYGAAVEDDIKGTRTGLSTDDIFFLPSGRLLSLRSSFNPRGMRDLSLLGTPAAALMMGPKFSEHQKHLVNEICRELGLDAVIVVLNKINWTAAQIKKSTQEILPEQLEMQLSSTVVVPYGDYHRRLKLLERRDEPMTNLSFRSYATKLRLPVNISHPPEDQTFAMLESELLRPMLKAYADLAQMMILSMAHDLGSTH